jgi:hypothetical protein
MTASETKRLKELELENPFLKRLLVDAELDTAMPKMLAEGNFLGRSVDAERSVFCRIDSRCRSAVLAFSPARTAVPNPYPCRC